MIYDATTRLAEAAMRLRALAGHADWRERLVLDGGPPRAAIWVHAASVGEVNSAAFLVRRLAQAHRLLVTTNSATGRAQAAALGVPARLAPLDSPGALRRFLAASRPVLQITIEGEFWPGRSRALAAAGIPQIVIGARMSERSARRWRYLPGLIGPVLARLAGLSAQDSASEARLLSLGLPPDALLPRLQLKLLGPAALTVSAHSDQRDRTVLAASTHEGEDGAILDAWQKLCATRPDLRLILAPRHPERGDRIAAMLRDRGVDHARRSQGAADAPLLLADTLGEMDRWYALAGICLTGGSWTDRGGHTPWEPAAHGCAILHGPHIGNFADDYRLLQDAAAARVVGADGLAPAMAALLDDPGAARAMGQAARSALDAQAGDPAPLLARIAGLAPGAGSADIDQMNDGKGR